ncbi:class E sortase [Microbacterium sp.]|uniref:class E sortase n=1 Tax=Microbacterium sp. TaxID=51671 RepID=UPI0039E2F754
MGETEASERAAAQTAVPHARSKRRVSVAGVIGEILITVGVVALLYVVWQVWVGDMIIGAQKNAEASALSQSWIDAAQEQAQAQSQTGTPTPAPTDPVIPVAAQPEHGAVVGVMFIPRFGANWQFQIDGGVTRKDILDQGHVGHYPDTAMPGEVGNTVYAAHRWTSGDPFGPIDQLVIGDAIVIQTPDGWYTYRFRTLEYVQDTQVDVLLPVPQQLGVTADARYLTLTSCAPKYNMLERIIAYAIFESFTPAVDGPPASLSGGTT